jgi:fumarate reductase subunit C
MNVRLYIWQRATAAVMLPLLLLHVALVFYASRHGMSAAEILARTRGSLLWATIYGTFVVAAAIHAAIGVRNVVSEWSPLPERAGAWLANSFGVVLLVLGLRAVAAVVLP